MTKGHSYYRTESRTDERYTPRELFQELDREFHFTTDPCADPSNRLGCKVYYSKTYGPAGDGNGLVKPWYGNVFINPPYGEDIPLWIERARNYVDTTGHVVVMLLKATPDVQWFHKYLWDRHSKPQRMRDGVELRFLEGRVSFLNKQGFSLGSAPFASMVVVLRRAAKNSAGNLLSFAA